MPITYRPQFLWLVMGPLLGAFSGTVVGMVLVWVAGLLTATSLTWAAIGEGFMFGVGLGVLYGGTCGLVVGFVVSIPLVFLVGRHLPRAVARRRAHFLGAVLPPTTLLIGSSAYLGFEPTELSGGELLQLLLPLAGAALLGSRLAAWAAGLDELPQPVS